jgi:hypothetical protein
MEPLYRTWLITQIGNRQGRIEWQAQLDDEMEVQPLDEQSLEDCSTDQLEQMAGVDSEKLTDLQKLSHAPVQTSSSSSEVDRRIAAFTPEKREKLRTISGVLFEWIESFPEAERRQHAREVAKVFEAIGAGMTSQQKSS